MNKGEKKRKESGDGDTRPSWERGVGGSDRYLIWGKENVEGSIDKRLTECRY